MLDAELSRGPDDWGLLVPDAALLDSDVRHALADRDPRRVTTYRTTPGAPQVVLGSRRLAILDLSTAGRMPMSNESGTVALTYNGEIYNFRELRRELTQLRRVVKSSGDTEILLRAYEQWGPNCVDRLRGMFAFSVWDTREEHNPRLFMARDRLGIKPLYWGRHSGVLAFASEVKSVVASGLLPNDAEPRAFHGFLTRGAVPSPWTTVRNLWSLTPAHSLTFSEQTFGTAKPVPYWALPSRKSVQVKTNTVIERTREILHEAVNLHMASDVPFGVFLSGGMDSTALVALASRLTTKPLTTICISFDESEFSEADVARRTSEQFGTRHIDVRITRQEFARCLPDVFRAMDQPTADGVNSYFVSKAAREAGLKVVLSGIGGDEVFRGYPNFRRYPLLRSLARSAFIRWSMGVTGQLLDRGSLGKLEFLAERSAAAPYFALRGLLSPRRAASLLRAGRLPLWSEGAPTCDSAADEYGRYEINCYLRDQLLRDADVFGMANSVEIRVPFVDHVLVEHLLRTPESFLASRGTLKPLLAAAMGDLYRPEILLRQKMGFTFPLGKWIQTECTLPRELTRVEPAPVARTKVVDDVEFHQLTRTFMRGGIHWSRVWAPYVLEQLATLRSLPEWPRTDAPPSSLLFLVPEMFASRGGIPTYTRQLLEAVAVILPTSELRAVSLNDPAMPGEAPFAGRVHFQAMGPRSRSWLKLRLVAAVLRTAIANRPDAVIALHINLAPVAVAISALTGAKACLAVYGLEAWNPRFLQRYFVTRVRHLVSISQLTANRLKRACGEVRGDLAIVPCMVDGETFRLSTSETARRRHSLLTVARLEPSERYKGVEMVLKALPSLAAEFKDISYRIAGTGKDIPRLQRLAEDLGVSSNVCFLGSVDEATLAGLYRDSEVFIMPSTNEGFGIVFLEAAVCGALVVAGNEDGSVEAVLGGELGTLVNPESLDEITRAARIALLSASSDTVAARARRRERALEAFGPEAFRRHVSIAMKNLGIETGSTLELVSSSIPRPQSLPPLDRGCGN